MQVVLIKWNREILRNVVRFPAAGVHAGDGDAGEGGGHYGEISHTRACMPAELAVSAYMIPTHAM